MRWGPADHGRKDTRGGGTDTGGKDVSPLLSEMPSSRSLRVRLNRRVRVRRRLDARHTINQQIQASLHGLTVTLGYPSLRSRLLRHT